VSDEPIKGIVGQPTAAQEDFVAAIEADDGLRAALQAPAFAARRLDDARLLML
jgi:hypothetical protein